MVASLEVARIVTEFKNCVLGTQADTSDHPYHEQHAGIQATFIS